MVIFDVSSVQESLPAIPVDPILVDELSKV